ncbi:MAG: thioredoxin family protein [Candidatus Thorarchaeota archaeon]|jgi:thiol-disulfide isomerase/thioredoxin
MILFFTSYHCAWCDVVRRMVSEENENMEGGVSVYEVNVEEHPTVADVYNVLAIPTLVSGGSVLAGLPTESDLRSFVLQSFTNRTRTETTLEIPTVRKFRDGFATLSRLAKVEARVLDMMGVKGQDSKSRKARSSHDIRAKAKGQPTIG